MRDIKVKFGRDVAGYVYLGHGKNDAHMTPINGCDQGVNIATSSDHLHFIKNQHQKKSV